MERAQGLLFLALSAGALALGGCSGCRSKDHAEQRPVPSAPANGLTVPAASVAAAVNPQNLPVYSGDRGSLEGTVFVEGDPAAPEAEQDFAKCPAAAEMYGKAFREGAPNEKGQRPLADAFVVVTGYKDFLPESSDSRRIVFDGCALPSRTITLTYGQRLEVANNTKLLVAPSFAEVHNPAIMIAPPQGAGDPVKLYTPHPGHFTLIDATRELPFFRADVWAFLHPLHAVTDTTGHFRIDGIPVGEMDVHAHLRGMKKDAAAKVKITANTLSRVELTLTYTAPPPEASAHPADAGRNLR